MFLSLDSVCVFLTPIKKLIIIKIHKKKRFFDLLGKLIIFKFIHNIPTTENSKFLCHFFRTCPISLSPGNGKGFKYDFEYLTVVAVTFTNSKSLIRQSCPGKCAVFKSKQHHNFSAAICQYFQCISNIIRKTKRVRFTIACP